MILYDASQTVGFHDFGIQIPIHPGKAEKVFQVLKQHPTLGPILNNWHIAECTEKITTDDLRRAHSASYVKRLYSPELENEIIRTFELVDTHGNYYRYKPRSATLPLSALLDRILGRVAGTVECCRVALDTGFCFYFSGGMHHAQKDRGNGFCILNDIVIAIRKLQSEDHIKTAWVIDVDAHKGDGTAAITQHDQSIVTLSVHMADGWPLDGEMYAPDGRLNPSFIPSDIDIPVAAGEEGSYTNKLAEGLEALSQSPQPDLALVVSGADPYEHDTLPSTRPLQMSLDQLQARDAMIYDFLEQRRIPMAYLMAGGYGERAWEVYVPFLERVMLSRQTLSAAPNVSKADDQ